MAYDLANIKPHSHLSGHQTIQYSFLNSELFEATSFSTVDNFFQALNCCRDLSRGWRNQLNLGIVPKRGQSRLRVSHSSVDQRRGLLREVTDKPGHGPMMESPSPQLVFLFYYFYIWNLSLWTVWDKGLICFFQIGNITNIISRLFYLPHWLFHFLIYLWLCWVLLAALGLSLAVLSRATVCCIRWLLIVVPLLAEHGL